MVTKLEQKLEQPNSNFKPTVAWEDRGSRIRDPFGSIWWLQTHVEDVDEAEIEQRMGEDR